MCIIVIKSQDKEHQSKYAHMKLLEVNSSYSMEFLRRYIVSVMW